MRGRVITALFLIGTFAAAFFAFGGRFFAPLMMTCFVVAFGEIMVSAWYSKCVFEYQCHPYFAYVYQMMILLVAIFLAPTLPKEELALITCTTMLADVSAFATGSLFGKHKVKFLTNISAKKSYEGFVGGFLIGAAISYSLCRLLGIGLNPAMWVFIATSGIIASLGDLLGSATKRQLGVKDSNEYMLKISFLKSLEWPLKGHGGYLDRFDSVSLCLVVYVILHALL